MKIGAIVQARMSSDRLPGKVLKNVAGKPLLQYILERLRKCSTFHQIIVATSDNRTDDPIAEYCRKNNTVCFRGPLQNVAKRFYMVLEENNLDAFVRVCGDSPMLDQKLIDQGVKLFKKGYDLVTNILPRTFPSGQCVEVVNTKTFKNSFGSFITPDELEHVTQYFYSNPDQFKFYNFSSGGDYKNVLLVVDTEEDLDHFKKIIYRMEKPHWEYGWQDIVKLLSCN